MDDERLQLEFEGLLTWNSVKGDVIEEPSFLCENFSKFHDDAYEVIIDEDIRNWYEMKWFRKNSLPIFHHPPKVRGDMDISQGI